MLDGIVRLLEKTNNVKRSSYFWNAVSAMVLAMQSPVILMVMNRTNGVIDAGIFSIAIAVGNLMMYVGQYGLRRFQSSDIREQYTFNTYHGMRIVTCSIMVIACLAYCMFGRMFRNYTGDKALVVFLVCMLKLFQAYTDVYHGHMQQRGRLDVATKCSSIRYALEIAAYCITLIITPNLVLATYVCVGVSFIVMMLTTINAGRYYSDSLKPEFTLRKLRSLAIDGFPLFLSMFLNIYVGNAPKYAIDAYLTDDVQAIFNMIFMPAFVIQIIAHFIFNPILTTYAELWMAEEKSKFSEMMKLVRKQCMFVLGLLVLAILVALTIGLPILSLWFGEDLSAYKTELCIIMFGGAMLAYSVYFSTIIAIIRVQRSLIFCYGAVSIVSLLISKWMVVDHGMMGASLLYAVLMTILAGALAAVVFRAFAAERARLDRTGTAVSMTDDTLD